MANAEHIPPPEVLRSQRNVMANDRDGAGTAQGTDPNSENDEWAQPMDYWYNRVISKSSPAATTANPSALGLIAFGYTTALLQVNPRMHAHACLCKCRLGSCKARHISSAQDVYFCHDLCHNESRMRILVVCWKSKLEHLCPACREQTLTGQRQTHLM